MTGDANNCPVEELGARLGNEPRAFLLLDVREPSELAIAALSGSRNIPLGTLLDRINELEDWKDEEILVLCHHGVRSAMACRILRDAGYAKVRNITGGIDAYTLYVDPLLRRY